MNIETFAIAILLIAFFGIFAYGAHKVGNLK